MLLGLVPLAARHVLPLLTIVFLLYAPSRVDAEVAVLGKGFFLNSAGTITSARSEVISGRNSLKGSYSGPNEITVMFNTDPTFIQFSPNRTYTISLKYRIITAASRDFSFGFFSKTGCCPMNLVPTAAISGAAGTTGTATHTATLLNYSDYQLQFEIKGTGAIVLDEVRVTTGGGELVASEDAEGPTLAPGPLNFQVTDALVYGITAAARPLFSAVRDLDRDGYPEMLLSFKAPRPSTTPIALLVAEARASLRVASREFFPGGVPALKNSATGAYFADLNADGLEDIVFSEAGSDGESANGDQFPGSRIAVGLNIGGGQYRDASALVPAEFDGTRSYAIAVGDINGDGRAEILLPDQSRGPNTALLRWNGREFEAERNWIDQQLWSSPGDLRRHSWAGIYDLDGDGIQDLVVGGDPGTPNTRILFGSGSGRFRSADLVALPDGPWGHTANGAQQTPTRQGAEAYPAIADFNNDGLLDIFSWQEQVVTYLPGVITDTNVASYDSIRARGGSVAGDAAIQVFINQGLRRFLDVTSQSPVNILHQRYYQTLLPIDMNNDGFRDVVGLYHTQFYAGVKEQFGTTVFLNDGTGAFQALDGADALVAVTTTAPNGKRWGLGAFVPTVVTPERTEGMVYEVAGWSGGAGYAFPTLNVYKVVANRAIGTGPNLVNSSSLGVPGFNEFFYLRRYPDAAAAVRSGEFRSGLAHYLAVGMTRGYAPHAPNRGARLR